MSLKENVNTPLHAKVSSQEGREIHPLRPVVEIHPLNPSPKAVYIQEGFEATTCPGSAFQSQKDWNSV